ncbi:MAG TPA: succinate dehydrogenase, cytochrome b556 subunit [Caulobacteraceae bacterium]|jgi:succinate dehydrogenase / fumarate reductase cytochrome b subunit
MADAAPGSRPRPISPNIQIDGGVWRWHVTMVASILHRATGMGLYVGALILMAWALSLAAGPDAYSAFQSAAGGLIGKIVFIGLTLCVFYHMANGVRHLVWDAGYGFRPKTADATAWIVFAFAVLATILLWAAILMMGAAQ